jgi:RNA polymerase sigma-70 factor (ECF subfamily)
VWKQTLNYDPAKSKRSSFVTHIVENGIASMIEHDTAEKRDHRRERQLEPGIETSQPDPDNLHQECDRRLDVCAAIAIMPTELQEIAWRLQANTEAEIMRATGFSRQQVRSRIARIEEYFRNAGIHPDSQTRTTIPRATPVDNS